MLIGALIQLKEFSTALPRSILQTRSFDQLYRILAFGDIRSRLSAELLPHSEQNINPLLDKLNKFFKGLTKQATAINNQNASELASAKPNVTTKELEL